MSEWKELTIGEICLVGDGAHSKVKRVTEGILYLTAKNFNRGELKLDDIDFISEEDFEKLFSKKSKAVTRPQENDILMGIIGSFGNAYRYKTNDSFGISSSVAILRPDTSLIFPMFLEYQINSKSFQKIHEAFSSGSVQGYSNIPTIKTMPIVVPPLDEQRLIAKLIGSIDQKITLLRQQNQDLEELAQTLFKRWFVEFEFPCLPSGYRPQGQLNLSDMAKVCTYNRVGGLPAPDGQSWFIYVLLCEDGSFYKGMTNDLYRRFYEHYTGDGAKHTITHKPIKVIHWEQFDTQDEARKREEELKTGYGRTWLQREYDKLLKYGSVASDSLPAQNEGRGLPAHQTRLMTAGKMVESELGEIPDGWRVGMLGDILDIKYGKDHKHLENGKYPLYGSGGIMRYVEKALFDKPSILIPRKGTLTNIFYLERPFWSVDTMFYSIIKMKDYGKYCYQWLKLVNFSQLDVGSAIPSLTTKLLNEMEILIPDEVVAKQFEKVLSSIFNNMNLNVDEIQTLTQLRDTLLPKLMSGELRVKI